MKKFILAIAGAAMLLALVPTAASAAPDFTEPSQCSDKDKAYFLFEYEDSESVGVDSGCSDSNEVFPSDVPGLIANELHVSCSDKIPDGSAPADKSDFGRKADGSLRYVTAYTIFKFKKGEIDKKCGEGNPIPSGGVAGNALAIGGIAVAGLGLTVVAARRRKQSLEATPA
jgi:hypothetical protein